MLTLEPKTFINLLKSEGVEKTSQEDIVNLLLSARADQDQVGPIFKILTFG